MTLQKLAYKENDLYSKVTALNHQVHTDKTDQKMQEIFGEYKKIHQTYADLSSEEIEALKRGLFIQWYALTEPNYLTGIKDLDRNAENRIIQSLNELIAAGRIDSELIWMLNYYSNWEWVFKKNNSFKSLDIAIVNEQNNQLPDTIEKEEMKLRGQMGKYWNLLTRFSKA